MPMTSFVILTVAQDIIDGIKRAYPEDHFRYSDREWFVADEGVTAQDVHRKLAMDPLTNTESKSTVIVCSIAGYYGRAQKNLWEWIAAKGNATKHVP